MAIDRFPTEEEMLVKMEELTRQLVRLGSNRPAGSDIERVATQADAAYKAFRSLEKMHAIRFPDRGYEAGYKAGYDDGVEDGS